MKRRRRLGRGNSPTSRNPRSSTSCWSQGPYSANWSARYIQNAESMLTDLRWVFAPINVHRPLLVYRQGISTPRRRIFHNSSQQLWLMASKKSISLGRMTLLLSHIFTSRCFKVSLDPGILQNMWFRVTRAIFALAERVKMDPTFDGQYLQYTNSNQQVRFLKVYPDVKPFIQSSKRKASGNTDKKISTGTLNAIFENLMQVSVVGLIIPWDKNLKLSGRWKEDIGGIQGPTSKYLLNNIWLAIDESLLTHPPLFCNQQLEQQREIFEYKYPIDKGMDHSARHKPLDPLNPLCLNVSGSQAPRNENQNKTDPSLFVQRCLTCFISTGDGNFAV